MWTLGPACWVLLQTDQKPELLAATSTVHVKGGEEYPDFTFFPNASMTCSGCSFHTLWCFSFKSPGLFALSLPMVTWTVFSVGGSLSCRAAECSCPHIPQSNRITAPAWRPAWVASPRGGLTAGCRYLSWLCGRPAPFACILLLEICRLPLCFFLGVSAAGPLMGDLLIW